MNQQADAVLKKIECGLPLIFEYFKDLTDLADLEARLEALCELEDDIKMDDGLNPNVNSRLDLIASFRDSEKLYNETCIELEKIDKKLKKTNESITEYKMEMADFRAMLS